MARCSDCQDSALACDACAEANARIAWEAYCTSGLKPVHVPDRPDLLYHDAWRGWRDWVRWTTGEPRVRIGFAGVVLRWVRRGGSTDGPGWSRPLGAPAALPFSGLVARPED